jgi:acyl dehydratase
MTVTAPETIELDDLLARVGSEIGVSPWLALDQTRFDAFAEVCDDHQFIHVDPVRAQAETPYGGTIAQGMLTLSLVVPLARAAIPAIAGARRGLNYGFDRVRFIEPVRAGARIRGRFTLVACDADTPGEVTMRWDVTVEIEGAARPAMVARWINRRYLRA